MESGSSIFNWCNLSTSAEAGEALLERALERAQTLFGSRLCAAYALGSLAHGGFSTYVSDVDFGLVIEAPLENNDARLIERLAAEVKATGLPLCERLSIFWGSQETLAARAEGGRFPPVDRLDLKQHGRLLAGRDVRERVSTPSLSDMVVAAARQSLQSLAAPASVQQMLHPASLVASGARTLTKKVLFPLRFLYTGRTGNIGRNEAAVEHFIARHAGPEAELASRALRWRCEPYSPADPSVLQIVRSGLVPIYAIFIEDYQARLASYGEMELAHAFSDWRARLRS